MADSNVFQSIEDHYRLARYLGRRPGGSHHFELVDPIGGHDQVYAHAKDVHVELLLQQQYEIFLTHLTHQRNWWGMVLPREKNPWLNRSLFPLPGQVCTGTVRRFIGDFIAILEPVSPSIAVEFAVHRDDLPHPYKHADITTVLRPGDRVSGEIIAPDRRHLQVNISVENWLSKLHRNWSVFADRSDSWLDEEIEAPGNEPGLHPELAGKRLAVIDDDLALCLLVATHFERCGMDVDVACSHPKGLSEGVYDCFRRKPDFIFLDFQLEVGTKGDESEVRKAVTSYLERERAARCCVISGNLEQAWDYAFRQGFGYLAKPLPFSDFAGWMSHPTPARKRNDLAVSASANNIFAVKQRTSQIVNKTNDLLDSLCERHELIGALWFIETSEERFEVRAYSRSMESAVSASELGRLSRSVFGAALAENKCASVMLPPHDPLTDCLRNAGFGALKYPNAFVFPLISPGQSPRCVVFFREGTFPVPQQEQIKARRNHFELLIEAINQSEELDEISASAQQGRRAIGAMHDMRTALSVAVATLDNVSDTAEGKLAKLRRIIGRVHKMSLERLEDFRPVRESKVDLARLIEQICTDMRYYLKDRYADDASTKYDGIGIEVHVDQVRGKQLNMNPMPLERALINLIDNSASFVADNDRYKLGVHTARRIWVRASVSENAGDPRPLKITVADSGPGISVADIGKVFQPRRTSRPEASTGLGLYVSKELITSVGGTIECLQRPRWSGAVFRISLPDNVG